MACCWYRRGDSALSGSHLSGHKLDPLSASNPPSLWRPRSILGRARGTGRRGARIIRGPATIFGAVRPFQTARTKLISLDALLKKLGIDDPADRLAVREAEAGKVIARKDDIPMSDNETLPEDSAATPIDDGSDVKRRVFSRITRELTEAELGTTGVQKLLIDEIEKTGAENFELKRFRDKYYQSERELAVANTALHRQKSDEIIAGGTLAVGSAALGYLPSLNDRQFWICGVFGVVLVLVSIWAKARETK